MKIPIIQNASAVLQAWKEGADLPPSTGYFGEGEALSDGEIGRVLDEVRKMAQGQSKEDRLRFDKEAAIVLRQSLALPPMLAAQPRFWAYLTIVKAQDLCTWRWNAERRESVPPARYHGGWKNTLRRLWLRADIVEEVGGNSKRFDLARHGGEDFWVSVIERKIGGCRTLVRALVKELFISGDRNASMTEHREIMKWLREVRPSRVYESMDADDLGRLIKQARDFARARPL